MSNAYLKALIPDEYANFDIEAMLGLPAVIDPIKKTLNDYLNNLLENEKNGAGLLFYGRGNGNGKTYSAYHILKKVKEVRLAWDRKTHRALISYTNIASITCRDYIKCDSDFAEKQVIERARVVPFLLLDELSTGAFNNNLALSREILYSLVDYRISFNLPTLYTSNCENLEELEKLLGEKLSSRIKFKNTLVNFTGPDLRPLLTEQLIEELQKDKKPNG